jgi:hypothetical protein
MVAVVQREWAAKNPRATVRQAIGLHVAQHGDREQSRRPHRPIGLLELARKADGCHDIAGAPDAGAAALAMRNQHRLAQPRGDRRGGMADMDHERAAADRGAVDPFRGEAQIMRDRHRRLAGGRNAVDVAGFRPASAIALNAASVCNWICDMSGMTPSRMVSAAPTG